MTIDFTGKVVLVTGGGQGIGRTAVDNFAAAGARVISVDVKPQGDLPAGCRGYELDVSNFNAVADCVNDVIREEGTIDVLVNNAGITRDTTIWKMAEEEWDAVLSVNVKGAFNFIRHVAPHFREKKSGRIVNVSSINGMRGKFGQANYTASKAAIIGLTKTVARELGRYGVTANVVAPGLVETPMTMALPPEVLEKARAETVLNRFAEPDDVVHAIMFLCSELARHITGEVIKVDGGQYI